jgi:very-short-patch-repair endonuclease
VSVDGLPVTTVVRTLCDLGRFVSADTVEAALNSALRGPDRRRPAEWNEALFTEVNRSCASTTTRRGIARLRTVVTRRGLVRPTGSYPETLLLMAARRRGINLVPQMEVRVIRQDSRPLSYFPDLGEMDALLCAEVEGAVAHSDAEQIDRDASRQNVLAAGFEIMRFQAGRVLKDPDACATDIAKRIALLRSAPNPRHAYVTRIDEWTCELRVTL